MHQVALLEAAHFYESLVEVCTVTLLNEALNAYFTPEVKKKKNICKNKFKCSLKNINSNIKHKFIIYGTS